MLAGYLPGLTLLRDYDEGTLAASPTAAPSWTLTLDEAGDVIKQLAAEFPADGLLGIKEKDLMVSLLVRMIAGDTE